MDGYEATQIIRSKERFKSLPIIAITAHAMARDRERCLEIGMNDYISKAIKREALYQVIKKWILDGKDRQ